MGYSYTEAFDDDAVAMLVSRAIGNAEVHEDDDPQFIFAGSPQYATVDAFSPALNALGAPEKIAMVKALEAEAMASSPSIRSVQYCTVTQSGGRIRLKNSKGLDLQFRSNSMAAYLMAIADVEGNVTTGFAAQGSPRPDIDAVALGRKAATRALERQGGASVPSGSYDIALFNETAAEFLSAFTSVFSADDAQKGKSRFQGREGSAVAADIVTIIDDPLMAEGYASAPFDDEGVATYTKPVVENGVLKTLLHNLKTAAKAGCASTGNASKAGLSGPVGVSPSNFYIKPGTLSFDGLLQQIGEGLLITELEGLHAGLNPVSGDFSLAAKGFRITRGKKGAPVEQITLAGNFYDLLHHIAALADDLYLDMMSGAVGSPTLWIKGLSVAGE
jgi:PmbA protein